MAALIGHLQGLVGAPGDVHTSLRNPLFSRAFDASGNEFIYLSGVAAVAIGSWVNIDVSVDGAVVLLDTDVAGTVLGRIAVATAAVLASQYGWFQVGGAASALALTGSTDTKNAFATSTAGSVDDSGAGAEVLVFGAVSTGAVDETSFLQAFALNRPFMIGITLD